MLGPQAIIDRRGLTLVDQAITYGTPNSLDRFIDVTAGVVVKSAPVGMRPLDFGFGVGQIDYVAAWEGCDTVWAVDVGSVRGLSIWAPGWRAPPVLKIRLNRLMLHVRFSSCFEKKRCLINADGWTLTPLILVRIQVPQPHKNPTKSSISVCHGYGGHGGTERAQRPYDTTGTEARFCELPRRKPPSDRGRIQAALRPNWQSFQLGRKP